MLWSEDFEVGYCLVELEGGGEEEDVEVFGDVCWDAEVVGHNRWTVC